MALWLAAFVLAALLFYFGAMGAAVGVLVAWLILFGVWIAFCCRDLCAILSWLFIAAAWAIAILGILGTICTITGLLCGNLAIISFYSFFSTLVMLVMAIAGCGRLPNPFDPSTWPPSKC